MSDEDKREEPTAAPDDMFNVTVPWSSYKRDTDLMRGRMQDMVEEHARQVRELRAQLAAAEEDARLQGGRIDTLIGQCDGLERALRAVMESGTFR